MILLLVPSREIPPLDFFVRYGFLNHTTLSRREGDRGIRAKKERKKGGKKRSGTTTGTHAPPRLSPSCTVSIIFVILGFRPTVFRLPVFTRAPSCCSICFRFWGVQGVYQGRACIRLPDFFFQTFASIKMGDEQTLFKENPNIFFSFEIPRFILERVITLSFFEKKFGRFRWAHRGDYAASKRRRKLHYHSPCPLSIRRHHRPVTQPRIHHPPPPLLSPFAFDGMEI